MSVFSQRAIQLYSSKSLSSCRMMDKPDAFIHLTAHDQWRLAFGQKLHGREKEKETIMDVATKVTAGLPSNKQQVLLVAGKPGSGKSRLVMDTLHELESQGWMPLTCKFDRVVHSQPLSIIAHAFNELLEIRGKSNSLFYSIRSHIEAVIQADDVVKLAKHIPSLVNYHQVRMLSADDFEEGDKNQTHRLFRKLLKALATVSPIAFFMDDLQVSKQSG